METAKKKRNYSMKASRRLPEEKMTETNGIKIPAVPGTCYHALICSLAQYKDQFCTWEKIYELTERYMRQYGGSESWESFYERGGDPESVRRRIRENLYTLTRTGKTCYSLRLHERGLCIYSFDDGAILLTGGLYEKKGRSYSLIFPDGRSIQKRHRGRTFSYREYQRLVERNALTPSCEIVDKDRMKKEIAALKAEDSHEESTDGLNDIFSQEDDKIAQVVIVLDDSYDQQTAYRLESLGLVVEQASGKDLIGSMPASNVERLRQDKDVAEVSVETSEVLN